MRHRIKTKRFNRDTNHRRALIRNLVRSLVEHGQITTTEAKAKETKRWADKLINKALNDTTQTRRQLHEFFGKRDVANTLVERVAPAMGKRVSGFSRIARLGKRRGDNVEMVTLTLVEQPKDQQGLKSGVDYSKTKKAKPAKKAATKKTTTKKSTSKPTAKKTTKKAAKK